MVYFSIASDAAHSVNLRLPFTIYTAIEASHTNFNGLLLHFLSLEVDHKQCRWATVSGDDSTISTDLTWAEVAISINSCLTGGTRLLPSSLSFFSAALVLDLSSIVSEDRLGG